MPDPTQANRSLAITTVLGPDKLLLQSISVTERLNQLFQIDVELSSTDKGIKFEDIVGTPATVSMNLPGGKKRYFNGFVTRFAQDQQGSVPSYRATISPWLWMLTRTADCHIYQNKTAPAIIEEVFKDHGFSNYTLKLSGTYATREFCVQYRESAFNFVSRLMEQEGICYFFQHQDGKHNLILADSASTHDPFPGYDTLTYRAASGKSWEATEYLTDWIIQKEMQPGAYVMRDFNFITPKADFTVNDNVSRTHENASFEIFDYPGGYTTVSDGQAYAKVRIQELQSQYEILRGKGAVRGVAAGSKFKLKGHPRADQERDYVVIEESLQATAEGYSTGGGGGGPEFECNFIAIPLSTSMPFRPPRIAPKPLIRGPQTAIVVGSSGAEIDPDQYGRVKVHFHWDRHDKNDQNSSCWVRVAQIWAGKQWGAIFIPRLGQEVVVEFLEGDPDRPLITGAVYNDDQKVPYTLPANKTQSGIKTRSTTGGSTDNFNELRFEDKKGSEQIFLQAEKDLVINVENDRNETIGKDRTETVSGKHAETISKDRTLTVKGKETKEVDDTLGLTVTGDVTETFKAGHTEKTTNTYTLQADTVSITGQTKITLTVGGNSITIDSNGIKINSSATLDMEAGSQLTAKASGPATIKGATVAINS